MERWVGQARYVISFSGAIAHVSQAMVLCSVIRFNAVMDNWVGQAWHMISFNRDMAHTSQAMVPRSVIRFNAVRAPKAGMVPRWISISLVTSERDKTNQLALGLCLPWVWRMTSTTMAMMAFAEQARSLLQEVQELDTTLAKARRPEIRHLT